MLFSQTHVTQFSKRDEYINAVGGWQSKQSFTLFGTATFEFRNTLKKDLKYLVKEGMILTTGSGSGVKYHCKEEEL